MILKSALAQTKALKVIIVIAESYDIAYAAEKQVFLFSIKSRSLRCKMNKSWFLRN